MGDQTAQGGPGKPGTACEPRAWETLAEMGADGSQVGSTQLTRS